MNHLVIWSSTQPSTTMQDNVVTASHGSTTPSRTSTSTNVEDAACASRYSSKQRHPRPAIETRITAHEAARTQDPTHLAVGAQPVRLHPAPALAGMSCLRRVLRQTRTHPRPARTPPHPLLATVHHQLQPEQVEHTQ